MLSLETAMFSQFGSEMSAESQGIMIALTGAGVSIAVIAMSAVMIYRTGNEIREIKKWKIKIRVSATPTPQDSRRK